MEDEPKMVPCPDCGGTGKIAPALDNLPGAIPPLEIDCPTCGGTGEVREQQMG
jgi:DnaJ-class molecular chaperone